MKKTYCMAALAALAFGATAAYADVDIGVAIRGEIAPGVKLVDDPEKNYFPMPKDASGQDPILVGRIRQDLSDPSGHSVAMFVAGDQLLKGAALNAVQIAEQLL